MLILMKTAMEMTTNPSRDQLPQAHVVLHLIQMMEMMRSSHLNTMYDQSLRKSTLLAVSIQLPRMLSCPHLLRLQFILQLKINPLRRLNKLQRNRNMMWRLFANPLSVFLCPHLQNIVKARTCMILILIGMSFRCTFCTAGSIDPFIFRYPVGA